MMKVRGYNGYDVDAVSMESGLACMDESLAQQHQKDDADINTIVRRFNLTGQLPTNVKMPRYGDFLDVTDYRSALHAVMEAEEAFMAMPAEVRRRFDNDPAAFVDFCSDVENYDEAVKLGLVEVKKEAAAEPPAPPVAQSPAPQTVAKEPQS